MKKSTLSILIALMLLLGLSAAAEVALPDHLTTIEAYAFEGDVSLRGRVTLPSGVITVGAGAFAGTRVHALIIPEGCQRIDGSLLAGTEAAYLMLRGSSTAISGTPDDVFYVFGPAFGSASNLENFYASETLVPHGGFYYSVTEGSALPLCAVDGSAVSGEVRIPKLVEGQPLRSLETLIVHGCDGLEDLLVPAYLETPSHLSVTPYQTMTASAPVPAAENASVGDTVTWTTSVTGAYGQVAYLWTFNLDGAVKTAVTSAPTVDYTLAAAGELTVSVSATDELGDTASATSAPMDVDTAAPVYRALIVGNTYPNTVHALAGPENDVAGMRTMLRQMTLTPYHISTRSNLTANEIIGAIQDTFSGASVNDVSLFYFSGHGTEAAGSNYHGALQGTGSTYLTILQLKAALDPIPGKKIVIVDTCHSGQLIGKSADGASTVTQAELNSFNSKVVSAFAASTQTRGENDLANSGYYVITAAHSTEQCVTMGHDANGDGVLDKHFGLFTYALCHGSGWNLAINSSLSLNADSDNNNEITLHEAYAYARWMAQQSNPGQTAQVYPDNSNLVIWAK